MLSSNTAYFEQKMKMKTKLEKAPGELVYGRKELVLRLVSSNDKSVVGEASLDLANYAKCLQRTKFSIQLAKSAFPDATMEL